jgi:hypothetical protein
VSDSATFLAADTDTDFAVSLLLHGSRGTAYWLWDSFGARQVKLSYIKDTMVRVTVFRNKAITQFSRQEDAINQFTL